MGHISSSWPLQLNHPSALHNLSPKIQENIDSILLEHIKPYSPITKTLLPLLTKELK
ncbi:hypothetical protein CLAVI_000302 [Candidatus Clavichlamydia salmonicola]|uniref:hypothetical protein n=1 Tax=Candidatus Clavichlamydia salmonicola TaxID=469812 RepID=UPI001891B97D|nr:hypothetical protein [Candidatus Clavichlamydia salmonicola]MBF5050687.1 hypothetical protein [Candidatus Clavichlamydia salmonicola]